MQLFQVIPDKFFNLLAGANKTIYADLLFLIYDQYRLTTLGLSREAVIDILTDYFQDLDLAAPLEVDEPSSLTPRERGNFVLRRLEDCGWVTLETMINYDQYVNLNDYAVVILEALDRIRHRKGVEYQANIHTVYVQLTSREAHLHPHLALETAYEQTYQLIGALKSLRDNIKQHTDRMLDQESAPDLLRLHFEEYRRDILDKSYHRLKTSDHVSKYRPKILERLDQWARPEWVGEIIREETRRQPELTNEELNLMIHSRLEFIRRSFMELDEVLEEIDRRNNRYAHQSLLRLKYILNVSKDTAGQLTDLLKFLVERGSTTDLGRSEPAPTWLAERVNLFRQEFYSEESLYRPPAAARQHEAEDLPASELDLAERRRRQRTLQTRLLRKLTRERINDFVRELLQEREKISAVEIPVETIEDFIRMIYVAAYAPKKEMSYTVKFAGERLEQVAGRFTLKNITIQRREGNKPWSGPKLTKS